MSTTASPRETVADVTGEAHSGPPRFRRDVIGVVLFAVVVGLAVGRFTFFQSSASEPVGIPEPATTSSLEQEVARLEEQVADEPQNLEAWQQLALAATSRAIQTGDPAFYDLAERALDRADEIAPGHPDTLVARGQLLLSLHRFTDARQVGEDAVAARPRNVASLATLVDAQVELGRYDEAADTLQQMLDVNPSLVALSRVSYLRELSGDLEGARLALRQAAQAGSESPLDRARIGTLIGALQLRLGDARAAEAQFNEALALEPTLVDARTGKARALVAAGDFENALALLDATAQRQPLPGVLALHAALLREAGRPSDAEDAVDVATASATLQEASGQIVDLEMALLLADAAAADAAADTDATDAALQYAEDAYAARPDNVFAADALAWARLQAGDADGARDLVEDALRLDGPTPATRVRMAAVLEATGEVGAAREQLERAFAEPAWSALEVRPVAADLAGRLGIEPPESWVPAETG